MTLMEVLIALCILAFISISIYQATLETYRLRDTLASEGDFYNSIRISMAILQRDISLIYSPLMTLSQNQQPNASPTPGANGQPPQYPPPASPQIIATYMSDDLNLVSTFWSAAVNETGLRPSRIVGTDSKLTFISTSNVRIYKDSPESEFAKVTYELRKDESQTDKSLSRSVLVKMESPNAFGSDQNKDLLIRTYPLLPGIKKFTFTYLQKDGNAWKTLKSWDSEREDTKNIFPDLIQVDIEVTGPKNQTFEGIFKMRPEIPLNGVHPSG